MTTVEQVLQRKGHAVWSLPSDASVYDAISLMADKQVGALLVIDAGQMVGLISERDYARKVILRGRSSRETAVHEIMTTAIVSVGPEQTIDECMALMTEQRIRHLPVVMEGHLVGIVSIGDVVKAILAEREERIAQLETYITRG